MRPIAWWGLLSALAAPILLIGGFTLAAARQPPAYDPCVDTISALAAPYAIDGWLMTCALYGLGFCHVATAAALRAAAPRGRFTLAIGGLATIGVAAFPTSATGTPPDHLVAAGIAFGALAIWPALARKDRAASARLISRGASFAATATLLALVLWFVGELASGSARVGLAERVAATAQALWPLAVVLSVHRPHTTGPGATGTDLAF